MTTIDSLQPQTVGHQSLRQHDPADHAATHGGLRGRHADVVNPWLTVGEALGDSLSTLLPAEKPSRSGESGRFAVHDVANALRTVLAQGGELTTGRVDGLLERVNAGFADAESALVVAGFDDEAVQDIVSRFRERLADVLAAYARSIDAPDTAAAPPAAAPQPATAPQPAADPYVAVDTTRARFVRKTSFSLDILTQEGDTVSLRVRNRQALNYGTAAATWADVSVSATRMRVVNTSRLSVEVQGDLSEQELDAIRDLLTQAEALAERFFAGDLEQAFAAGAALQVDTAQLAEVALRMKVRERLAVSAANRAIAGAALSAAPPQAATADVPGDAVPPGGAPSPVQTPAPATTTDETVVTTTTPRPEQSLQSLLASLKDWAQAPLPAGRLIIGQQFRLQLMVALVDLRGQQE